MSSIMLKLCIPLCVAFWDCPHFQIVPIPSAHTRYKVLEFEFAGGQSENAYTRFEIASVLDLYRTYSNWFVYWLLLSRRRGEQWMHAPVVGLPMITQHAYITHSVSMPLIRSYNMRLYTLLQWIGAECKPEFNPTKQIPFLIIRL